MLKNILIGINLVLSISLISYVALVGGQSGQLSGTTDLTDVYSQLSKLNRKVFSAGGTTNYDNLAVRGFQVGTTTFGHPFAGEATTSVSRLLAGQCELIGTNISITASTSAPFDCKVPGIISTDAVMVQIGTSSFSGTANSGFFVYGAKASSTSGFLTVVISNQTGTGRIPSNFGFGSTTYYWVYGTTTTSSLGN